MSKYRVDNVFSMHGDSSNAIPGAAAKLPNGSHFITSSYLILLLLSVLAPSAGVEKSCAGAPATAVAGMG